jgi:two-component system sensor histidine kinase CpxA
MTKLGKALRIRFTAVCRRRTHEHDEPMKIRFPLFAKIGLWLFLNLLFLGVVFYAFLRAQFHLGLDSLLMGRAGDRVQAVCEVITFELNAAAKTEWNGILKRFASAYHVQFFLFRTDGTQVAGETLQLPAGVQARLIERRGPPWGQQREPGRPPIDDPTRERFRPFGPSKDGTSRGGFTRDPSRWENGPREGLPREGGPPDGISREGAPREGPPPFRNEAPQEFRPGRPGGTPPPMVNAKFMMHTSDPSRYWVLARIPVFDRERPRPAPVTLVMLSDSLWGGGLFFDAIPWAAVGLGVVFLSVLFWLPLVRGITRSISQVTNATEEIAEGHFEARVQEDRRDELGRLGQAINRMATRLSGFVMGQKRFLGDIAHELCSPIARIQMALGILEQRADANQKAYVDDVREEVQHMSSLVNELLSFSKAGLRQREVKLEPVQLAPLTRRVVEREAAGHTQIEIRIEDSLRALAEPELVSRAMANLVRNAVRYAGKSGPITITAIPQGEHIVVSVADSGPGVPEDALAQIFDPFFRLESSRSRETGGAGLGLAIVKTCVEACQGTVVAKNRSPSGLQVEIQLKATTK